MVIYSLETLERLKVNRPIHLELWIETALAGNHDPKSMLSNMGKITTDIIEDLYWDFREDFLTLLENEKYAIPFLNYISTNFSNLSKHGFIDEDEPNEHNRLVDLLADYDTYDIVFNELIRLEDFEYAYRIDPERTQLIFSRQYPAEAYAFAVSKDDINLETMAKKELVRRIGEEETDGKLLDLYGQRFDSSDEAQQLSRNVILENFDKFSLIADLMSIALDRKDTEMINLIDRTYPPNYGEE